MFLCCAFHVDLLLADLKELAQATESKRQPPPSAKRRHGRIPKRDSGSTAPKVLLDPH